MSRNLGLATIAKCLFGVHPANARTAKAKWALDGAGVFRTLSRIVEEAPTTASAPPRESERGVRSEMPTLSDEPHIAVREIADVG